MLVSAAILWSLALILGTLTVLRPGRRHVTALRAAGLQAVVILPRILMAVLARSS